MKKVTCLSLFVVLSALVIQAFTQVDEPLDTLLSHLGKYITNYPQEKVHLQLDKPYYSVGEDIWLKAYVVDAKQNHLSDQSKILYVDLLDERDSVRQTLLLPVENGLARGNIHLSDTLLSAGNYHICAYTKWMQNFSSEYFFKKDIPVVNALKGTVSGTLAYSSSGEPGIVFKKDDGSPFVAQAVSYVLSANDKVILQAKGQSGVDGRLAISYPQKNNNNTPVIITTTVAIPGRRSIIQHFVIRPLASVADVQFFPESGHLVTGIRTKIGFKALKPDGLGEDISGYIADESNEHVAEFRSEHAGMGVFALLPVAGKAYTAVIRHADGSEKRYPLPKAEASGYVLNVNRTGKDSLSVKISASADLLTGKEAVLIAQCNGVVQFVAKTKLDAASNLSILSTKKFPNGITQFTLFTPEMVPVAERLVFIDHNNGLRADIKTDKTEYAKRGKVNLDLAVTDAYEEPVTGSFSVAVIDESKVKTNEDEETSILSNLLLTSDIKGHIQQPNYYFNPQNPDRQKHLDQLLLTQGWRRFSWADLQAGKFPTIKYQHEQSLAVSGSILTLGNKPVPKGKVTLMATTPSGPMILDTIADEDGRFVFNDLDFPDSTKIVVKATKANNGTQIRTIIDRKPRLIYPGTDNNTFSVTGAGLDNYLKQTQQQFTELTKLGLMKDNTLLKEVTIKAIRERDRFTMAKMIPHSANLDPGSADYVIKSDVLEHETYFLDIFHRVPGVEVKGHMVYSSRANNSVRPSGAGMLVVADGAYLTGKLASDFMDALNPHDVAGVEVLIGNGKTVYGNAGIGGVLIITTKRGGEDDAPSLVFNIDHSAPQGYSAIKEFYAPAYDTPAQNSRADLRSTIYWNPDVVTGADGKVNLSYFNADGTGTYKVTLEGMDTKGGLLRKTYTYLVK